MPAQLPDDLDPTERVLFEAIEGLRTAGLATTNASEPTALSAADAALLFESQFTSRTIDHTARWLRQRGIGYYTIGSAGHESNAAVAMALRPTDPALLHYRSGGFYIARAAQVAGQDPIGDILRGMLAKSTEPIAGGRHKVFGSRRLNVIPQTSTIASHLPRAVGMAISMHWAARPKPPDPVDSIVVCSFGDASLNHSTAQGALNWALHAAHRGQPTPVLFVCEDNGLGISVATPPDWVRAATEARWAPRWRSAAGDDPEEVLAAATELAEVVRRQRVPAMLHLRTVRYLGHAGADVETSYRSAAEIRADEAADPIVATARLLVARDGHEPRDLLRWCLDQRDAVRERAIELCDEPELLDADEVMAPLRVQRRHRPPSVSTPAGLTLAQSINHALSTALTDASDVVVFGEDVARKGGVYGVTRGLQRSAGEARVFDTLLDEQSILGLALGAALHGVVPVPEIQYLAYVHNASDQLRGEGATLPFFSSRQYVNPMVVRIAAYGYQKGFGGHFHNDNSIAALRDIPGVVIASPSRPEDAAAMLATCIEAARVDGVLAVFLEPIALYHTTDLHHNGDSAWLSGPSTPVEAGIGVARVHHVEPPGGVATAQLTIATWANGLYWSLRAARRMAVEQRVATHVVDLRWLSPLPIDAVLHSAQRTGNVLVVDETRATGGVGEGLVAGLIAAGCQARVERIAGRDSFVPLGAAATLVLVSEAQIIGAAQAMLGRGEAQARADGRAASWLHSRR